MKAVKLSEAKDNLSRYVEAARRGEAIRILVRGVPAADLVPITGSGSAHGAEDFPLEDLERSGLIRCGKGGVPRDLLKPGPRARGISLADAVAEERRRGW